MWEISEVHAKFLHAMKLLPLKDVGIIVHLNTTH